jgi:hypothetical protein
MVRLTEIGRRVVWFGCFLSARIGARRVPQSQHAELTYRVELHLGYGTVVQLSAADQAFDRSSRLRRQRSQDEAYHHQRLG